MPAQLAATITTEPCASCGARAASVCNAIGDADLARLAAAATARNVEPGASFMADGEPATHFFNVTHGTARLVKLLPDGRRQILGFARPGHFLGLAPANTYVVSAEAVEPMRVCRFARAQIHALVREFPALERRLLETASSELAAAQEGMVLLGRKTARERVASFLLSWARGGRACTTPATHLHLPMGRGDIADFLGLTIETVSRTLTRLRAEGLIALPEATEVRLLRPDALAAIAAGEE
jgi:CRP/FNR family transcriptional regulator, anaerobic regulatory protein